MGVQSEQGYLSGTPPVLPCLLICLRDQHPKDMLALCLPLGRKWHDYALIQQPAQQGSAPMWWQDCKVMQCSELWRRAGAVVAGKPSSAGLSFFGKCGPQDLKQWGSQVRFLNLKHASMTFEDQTREHMADSIIWISCCPQLLHARKNVTARIVL